METISYAAQIRSVSESLTDENWQKGGYFDWEEERGTICRCVHGQAQIVSNPQVREAFEHFSMLLLNKARHLASQSSATHIAEAANICSLDVFQMYKATVDAIAPLEEAKRNLQVQVDAVIIAHDAEHNSKRNSVLHQVWMMHSKNVRTDFISEDNKNYGNGNLHYLLGMFGITAAFNDEGGTTLEMLKAKLEEAAQWAEKNEDFLANN